jgi:hypothetical protein
LAADLIVLDHRRRSNPKEFSSLPTNALQSTDTLDPTEESPLLLVAARRKLTLSSISNGDSDHKVSAKSENDARDQAIEFFSLRSRRGLREKLRLIAQVQ